MLKKEGPDKHYCPLIGLDSYELLTNFTIAFAFAHVVHITAKQVISRRRKNESVYKMSKNEKCTCKACKNTVFHCQICKFMGFLLQYTEYDGAVASSRNISLYTDQCSHHIHSGEGLTLETPAYGVG